MSTDERKALIKRVLEEAWNLGNLDALDELYAPEYVQHNPPKDDLVGLDSRKKFFALYRTAFPDLKISIEEMLVEGDIAAIRLTWQGTFIGEIAGLNVKPTGKPVVSIAIIENDKIGKAVEKAIDLLGGIKNVTRGKDRIMLKPNLVAPSPTFTTKPIVIKTLAQIMKRSGKEVLIGEGSAGAERFNVEGEENYRTTKRDILDPMQQHVFDELGYPELAKSLKVPLINLHSGEISRAGNHQKRLIHM